MKKWIVSVGLLAAFMTLVACGAKDQDKENAGEGKEEQSKEIVVGASNTPHSIILEKAQPLLEEKGYSLKIETYQDYILPNKDLESGQLDANYFQHIQYLEGQMKDFGYQFAIAGEIHSEPIGIYSKKYKSLEELPEGATVLMSNSVADHGRVLAMLEDKGLIQLDPDVDKVKAELGDIIENPKKLQFDPNYEPALMPQLYHNNEGDALLINSNYAIDAGIVPAEEAIAIEKEDTPFVNVLVVREEDQDNPKIQALVEVLKSEEIRNFMLEEWGGAVIPAK